MTEREGFIVHCYADSRRGKVHVLGRLADGRSFAASKPVPESRPCVRAADFPRLETRCLAEGLRLEAEETSLRAFDGSECLELSLSSARDRSRLAGIARTAGIPVFGLDSKGARDFLVRNGIRAGIRIRGEARAGRGVDAVFPDAVIEPLHGARAPLTVLSFDIETAEPSGIIRCVALTLAAGAPGGARDRRVIFAGPWNAAEPPDPCMTVVADEAGLLRLLAERVRELDPDIITGWNIIDFDFPRLASAFARHRIPFTLGRSIEAGVFFPAERDDDGDFLGKRSASVFLPGRQVLDGLRLIRSGGDSFDSYALDAVAREVLGRGKTVSAGDGEKLAELDRLYRDDPLSFCRYCLNDADLVIDILEKKDVIRHTVERAALTGAGIDKAWTSVASFERVYALELWERGFLEPELTDRPVSGAAGGTVLEPVAGIFGDVAVFDFRSLYPSIIRTFNIDPLAHESARANPGGDPIVAPNGAAFSREGGILPALIAEYFAERLAAIDRGDDSSAYVYKILMNSFYGVLGSGRCRYARTELAGAITSFGKLCLHFARDFFVSRGFRVLYGDTDSVFVEMGASDASALARCAELAVGLNAALADRIRDDWRLESFINIRFEKMYRRFFIPRLRGPDTLRASHAAEADEAEDAGALYRIAGLSDVPVGDGERGRAKGYAGLALREDGSSEVEIKGMEAARSDYTPLARRFQRELLDRLFRASDTVSAEEYIRGETQRLFRGELDGELVFRKKLRREPESYTASTPPHIKVARALGWSHRRGTVEYVMTDAGPQALSMISARIDYAWYASTQLLPLARSAGYAAGFDADAIISSIHPDGQLELDLNPGNA